MNILVIGAHPDDEVLGCGGTIVRHVDVGHHVTVCIVANRAYDHKYIPKLIDREKASCQKAQEILCYQGLIFLDLPDEQLDHSQIDIITPLEKVLSDCKPDIVYIPHRGDLHQDHRAVFDAVRVICRPLGEHCPATLRVFEVPSSTDQVPGGNEWPFVPNYYVDIEKFIDQKLKAMECYSKESRDFPHPRSLDGLRIYAQKRGMEVGMQAGEAFMILRDSWW